ncbi:MAG: hypothetical protein U0325_17155 [Polyangiales bacterium]
MTRVRLLASSILPALFAACASTPSAPAPARGTRFVLVPLSVTLRQRRRRRARRGVPPRGTSLEVAAFRRVRTRGEWVLVEPPARPERQCHPTLMVPAGMQLRFWVRAAELAPVLVRTVTRRGADGAPCARPDALRVVRDGDLARASPSRRGHRPPSRSTPARWVIPFAEPRPTAQGEPGNSRRGPQHALPRRRAVHF